MINVITAINNPEINEKLKKEKDIEVLAKDICYEEGIFEILEKYKKINFLLISKKISINIKIEKLINKIKEQNKKIKIILLIKEDDKKIINKNIYKIVDEKIEIKNLIKILKNENYEQIEKNKKIITILGTNGIGKTIFSIILAKIISKKEKILIINMKNNNYMNLKKINKNIFLKSRELKINGKYKYIFIEANNLTKEIIENTNLFLFLIGGNLLEIEKAKKLLKIYSTKVKNIKLIINKYTCNNLDIEIIKNIFNNFEIIGKINYSENYDLLINKNLNYISKEIKIDYNKIIKKLKGEKTWN